MWINYNFNVTQNFERKMDRVGIIGVLLIPQTVCSTGCQPHVSLIKEEEKCQLLKADFTTNCTALWDHLNCWPPSLSGQTVSQPCPDFFNSDGTVHRNCTAEGWTDLLAPHEEACGYNFNKTLPFLEEAPESHLYFSYVRTMYTVGYTLSLISLSVAITIFCLFRKLHCTRNHIHVQLFVSFILRAVFIFIRDSMLFADEELYHCDSYPVGCKVALMLSNYAILANYSWLLSEGHFLFTLVTRSFFSLKKHLAWYIALSWGVPFVTIVAWGFAKYFYEDEGCWETRRHEWIWWILRVPVLLTIITNVIFFLGILRIIVSKLRMPDAQRNEVKQYKRLIKSTFFLVALFGLQYIVFAFLPVSVSSLMFKIWTFAELALSSTQGFVVSILYCFLNGEVQYEIQRRWRRWRMTRHLPSPPRQYRGSISQSGSPLTQVSMLPGLPADTACT